MPAPQTASASASAITDADIAAIVVAANTIDADMGQLALSKSRNAELKATLVSVRPAFVTHLQHAQHVQASLGGM